MDSTAFKLTVVPFLIGALAFYAWVVFLTTASRNPPRIPAGGVEITVDLLQGLAFLLALSALLIAVTLRVVNKRDQVRASLEAVANAQVQLSETQKEITENLARSTPSVARGYAELSALVVQRDLAREHETAERSELKPWGWGNWFFSCYAILWVAWAQGFTVSNAQILISANQPTMVAADWLHCVIFLLAWALSSVFLTRMAAEFARGELIHINRLSRITDEQTSQTQHIAEQLRSRFTRTTPQ